MEHYFNVTSDRYEDIGDAAVGHSSYAGQCLITVFLRLLHLRHRRRAALGRYTTPTLLPEGVAQRQVSRVS